jgi:hypothetical protein
MSARAFMRSAATFTLLLALGHSLGHPWTPANSAQGAAIVSAMQSYQFDATGMSRSYYDFYEGFGWIIAAYLFGHAVLFWLVGGAAASETSRPVVAVLFLEALVVTALSWKFLFLIPVALSGLIAASLGGALVVDSRSRDTRIPVRGGE